MRFTARVSLKRRTRPFHYRRDRFKSYHLRPLVNFRPFSEVYRRFFDLSRTSRSRLLLPRPPLLRTLLTRPRSFLVLRRGRVLRSSCIAHPAAAAAPECASNYVINPFVPLHVAVWLHCNEIQVVAF